MVSNVFERILVDQLTAYFEKLLSSCLSAYRKGYRNIERHTTNAIVILASSSWRRKLRRYCSIGVWSNATRFTHCEASCMWSVNQCLSNGYLKDRRQCVKVMGVCSDWTTVNCSVSQGSVMGPLLFNMLLNDLFYVKMNCEIPNYADDTKRTTAMLPSKTP